jgi:hypothetical protein
MKFERRNSGVRETAVIRKWLFKQASTANKYARNNRRDNVGGVLCWVRSEDM